MEKLMQLAEMKIQGLNWEECELLYNKLEAGHEMRDLVMDRMEDIDEERFDKWLG